MWHYRTCTAPVYTHNSVFFPVTKNNNIIDKLHDLKLCTYKTELSVSLSLVTNRTT